MKQISLLLIVPFVLFGTACRSDRTEAEAASTTAQTTTEITRMAEELRGAGIATPAAPDAVPDASAQPLMISGEITAPLSSEVVPRISGRVAAILVDTGDVVRRGQPLLRLETEYQNLDVARAESEVKRARSAANEAERDFARKQELLRRNSIPQAVHDRSQSAYEQARAALESAQSAAATTRQRLADAVVRAPFDGVVAERRIDPGERLSEASVAYVITQLQPLRVRFELPERYLPAVKEGQQIRARVDAYPGEAFTGDLTTISRVVRPENRSFVVEAQLANKDLRLRPGMFARVEIPGLALVAAPSEVSE